jgi:hypothetical protein
MSSSQKQQAIFSNSSVSSRSPQTFVIIKHFASHAEHSCSSDTSTFFKPLGKPTIKSHLVQFNRHRPPLRKIGSSKSCGNETTEEVAAFDDDVAPKVAFAK